MRNTQASISVLWIQFYTEILKRNQKRSPLHFNWKNLWGCFLKVTKQGVEGSFTILSMGRHGHTDTGYFRHNCLVFIFYLMGLRDFRFCLARLSFELRSDTNRDHFTTVTQRRHKIAQLGLDSVSAPGAGLRHWVGGED